jgi:hypothetical protein
MYDIDDQFYKYELHKYMLITHTPTNKVTKCEVIINYTNDNDILEFDYDVEFEFNILQDADYFGFTDKELNNYEYEVTNE